MDFDVSAAVAGLVGMSVGLGLIGAAKMGPAVVAVGWKWFKAMIFG